MSERQPSYNELLARVAQLEQQLRSDDVAALEAANEKLRESEREFRSLAEAMPQIVWATRKDGWNVYFNQQWVDYTGLTLAESHGHGWNTPFHPEDRQRAWDAWQTATNSGAPYSLECRLRRADGEYRWWLVRGVPVLDQNGEILKWFGTCTDIDDMKLAEAALRKGEAELRAVLDASPFPVAIVDVNGDNVRFWSRSAQALFGHTPPTALEWYRLAYPDPSYRRDVLDRWNPLLETARTSGGTVNTGEYQITCSDGRVRRCELYASFLPDRLIVTFDDVTDRKRALDARDASETRYRRLFEAAKDGILILDAVTGMIVDVNPFLTTLTGYSHEDFLGKHLWEIGPFKDVAASKDSFAELQTQDYVRYEDLPLQTHDGRKIEVEFVSNVYLVDNRRVIQCNVRDISERRQAERVREKLEEQLRVSQKMEAIGGLAGGIAHDFNNLLSVILSYTGFALEGLREGDPLKDDLLEVKLAGERGAALTRQLLAFSRKQMLQPVPLNLNRVAADVDNMLRRILGEDIDLVQVLAPDLGVTQADQGQMEQVLMNLVVNARDAMPAGGQLTIETANVDLTDEYAAQHVAVKPGPYIQLVVTDTGCGMDAQTRTRIFEPFFTTKEQGKGTGLGLSMVYGIVKQSGGNIWVYSELGKGTAFKVYLPRDLAATPAASRPPGVPRLARGTETILVVEDEEALRKVAERTLGAAGYTVLAAANGGEALLTCSQHRGDLHLLLTDVVMPRMSGRVLAEELVKIRPTLKVIYMSGYTDDAIVHHGVLDAGTHFLGKPFSAAELTAKVREVLDEGLAKPESGAVREAEVDGDTTK